MYVFPIGLVLIGVWLIARNFENVPRPDAERLIGVALFFILLLVLMHMLISPPDPDAAKALAMQGKGGGQIGAALMTWLQTGLGSLGLAVLVITGFIISLALALDTRVVDLFTWVPPLVLRLQDAWDERQAARRTAQQAG